MARLEREKLIQLHLKLQRTDPARLGAAIEQIAGPAWIERAELVARGQDWLAEHESRAVAGRVGNTLTRSLIWGHSGLCRRPNDGRWERRTDVLHRQARDLFDDGSVPTVGPEEAIEQLIRVHLGSYGPARLADMAWWMGVRITPVRMAVARIGRELCRFTGPAGEELLDLVDLSGQTGSNETIGPAEVGTRLLPEFDGLTVGYRQDGRDRFLDTEEVATVWSAANGQVSPVVLHRGRLVGRWRTVPARPGLRIEIIPFRPDHGLRVADLEVPAAGAGRALGQPVVDVLIGAPTLGRLDRVQK